MANEQPSTEDETRKLVEEVEKSREEQALRNERERKKEILTNRVSVAAIIMTTALSFISNVKSDRTDAVGSAKHDAEIARREAGDLWAYYQTKLAERSAFEIARDRVRLELTRRGVGREDPAVKLDALELSSYEERIDEFESDTQLVFFKVQALERQEARVLRTIFDPDRAAFRYDLAIKLITLALILYSVTILANKGWLFWGGTALGAIGVMVAFDGYLLLV